MKKTPLRSRLLAATVVPLLVLALAEGAVRALVAAPKKPLLFERVTVDGAELWQRSIWRPVPYYPPTTREKPAGTLRVACIGGSTVEGRPFPAQSFPRVLEELLRSALDPTPVEVLACGVGGQYSLGELDVLEEMLQFDLDAVVLYSVHNEFHPQNVRQIMEAAEHPSRERLLALAGHLRLCQLLADRGQSKTEAAASIAEKPPERRPIDGPEFPHVLETFRRRVERFCELTSGRDIPLVLCTAVCNLRDFPPLADVFKPEIALSERQRYLRLLDDAALAIDQQNLEIAAHYLRSAELIDTTPAGLYFQRARLLNAQGKRAEALAEFVRARDYDGRLNRGPSAFNDAIRSFAGRQRVAVSDVEAAFARLAPDGIVGHEAIIDNVHPNIEGARTIAREILRTMAQAHFLIGPDELQRIGLDRAGATALAAPEPAEIEARIGMANLELALEKGRFEGTGRLARRHLTAARQLAPKRADVAIGLALLLGLEEHHDLARKLYAEALGADPAAFQTWAAASGRSQLIASLFRRGGVAFDGGGMPSLSGS